MFAPKHGSKERLPGCNVNAETSNLQRHNSRIGLKTQTGIHLKKSTASTACPLLLDRVAIVVDFVSLNF